jgi:serine/threonine protein kinase
MPPPSLSLKLHTPKSPRLRILQIPDFGIPNNRKLSTWLNANVLTKELIGRGKISEAYTIVLKDGRRFILRETYMSEQPTRNAILHEMDVYQKLLASPDSKNYVSRLLYAECPLTYDLRAYSTNNYAYFLFEHTEGVPLDKYIASKSPISAKRAIQWTKHLLEGAEFLGRLGIVHRDIKPSNLFVDLVNDRIVMFDFEISCFIEGQGCLAYEFHGTRPYARNKALDVLVHDVEDELGFHDPYEYTVADDTHAILTVAKSDLVKTVVPSEKREFLQMLKALGGSSIRSL